MSSSVRAVAEEALSPHWADQGKRAAERAPESWLGLVGQLRELQDAVAGSVPPPEVAAEVSALLARSRQLLEPYAVSDEDRVFGRLLTVRGRGQTLIPPLVISHQGDGELRATTQFGAFYAGSRGAVHGGALALMFDDAMGHTAGHGHRPPFRTAYLRLEYRSVAPLGRTLAVAIRVTEQAGRKRYLHGTLHDGDRLCAEATALFVDLRPGQP